MKITQLFLKNYGPLKNKDYQFKSGFNLLYGPNEKGKSLTFDALVKLLLGKGSKKFDLIDRVDDDPGQYGSYVNLHYQQDGKNTDVKLQGKPDLSDLVGLNPDECENLFLIRNSNLSIGQDLASQDQFYTTLTDRLTGLKTKEISQVKDQLRDLAQITDKSDQFQNTQETNHLRDRLEQAQSLLSPEGRLTQLIDQDQTEQWSQIEVKALKTQQRLKNIKQELEQLSQAKQRVKYLSAKETLEKLKKTYDQIQKIKTINSDKIDKFKEHRQLVSILEKNLVELKKDIQTKQKKIEETEKNLEQVQTKLAKQEKVQQQLESQLRPQLDQVKQDVAQSRSSDTARTWKLTLLGSSSILILLLIAYIIHPAVPIIILLLISGLATVLTGLKYFLLLQQNQKLETRLEQLKLDLAQFDIEGDEVEQLAKKLAQAQQDFSALKDKKMKLTMELKGYQDDITQLKDKKMQKIQADLTSHQQGLEQIKLSCKVENWKELQQNWEKKQQLEIKLKELAAVLEEKLGKADSKTGLLQRRIQADGEYQQKINYWTQKIDRLAPEDTSDKAQEIDYSPQKEEQLKKEQLQLRETLEQSKQRLTTFKEQARDLEREMNDILVNREEPILCETMADIYQVQQELKNFISRHEDRKNKVLRVIEILDEIKQQEKQKVGELFGDDSQISRHFSLITDGRYSQVFFDQDENRIKVETADNKIFNAEQLSSGTYDQLYFAIRLGLGQKLLNEQSGFFIMDDPFLKADENRLQQQLDMLFDLAENGWQIIYFSAKKEVKDYAADKADKVISV